jgi:hypothetical protein
MTMSEYEERFESPTPPLHQTLAATYRPNRARRRSRRLWVAAAALVQIAVPRKRRPVCAMEDSSPKHGIPDFRRGLTLNAQTSQSELSLADAVQ